MDWSAFSEVDLETVTTAQILQRGREYYENGYVLQACRLNQILAARILGNGCCYEAKLSYETAVLSYSCTCPYPDFCKHLAALALAWLERPECFCDLSDALQSLMATDAERSKLLQHLISQHPLDLLNLRDFEGVHEEIAACGVGGFQNVAVLNGDAFEERLEGACRLLHEHLRLGEEAALIACEELLQAAAEQYYKFGDSAVLKVLELVEQSATIYEERQLQPLFKTVWKLYEDFDLWELQEVLRDTLKKLIVIFPRLLVDCLLKVEISDKYLQQISLYELLTSCEQISEVRRFLLQLYAKMEQTVVGSLWLIEKVSKFNPDEAKRKLRHKMAMAETNDKIAYRERLIAIHASLGEAKQAAALSFLQFEYCPNFSEFQRLKNFLNSHPDEFQGYYHRICVLLKQRESWILLMRVMISCDDIEELAKILKEQAATLSDCLLSDNDFAVELIAYLGCNISRSLIQCGIYELLMELLLPRYEKDFQTMLLDLCAEYKKYCKVNNELNLWNGFAEKLQLIIDNRPDLERRFKALVTN